MTYTETLKMIKRANQWPPQQTQAYTDINNGMNMMSNGGGQAAAPVGSNGGLLGGLGGLLGGLALGGILPSLLGGMKGIDGKQIGNDVYQGVKQGISNDIKSAGQTVWNGVKAAGNSVKDTAEKAWNQAKNVGISPSTGEKEVNLMFGRPLTKKDMANYRKWHPELGRKQPVVQQPVTNQEQIVPVSPQTTIAPAGHSPAINTDIVSASKVPRPAGLPKVPEPPQPLSPTLDAYGLYKPPATQQQ